MHYDDDCASYDNEYTAYYHNVACNSSTWASEDAVQCGCRGGGWFLSQLDTWHRCPIHGRGVAHPEERDVDECDSTADVHCPIVTEDLPPAQDDNIPF